MNVFPLAQPNFPRLAQSLDVVSQEVRLLPNVDPNVQHQAVLDAIAALRGDILGVAPPGQPPTLSQQVTEIRNELVNVRTDMQDVLRDIGEINRRIDQLEESNQLFPMRLANASAHDKLPVQWPPNTPNRELLDATAPRIATLARLTVAECGVIEQALGIHPPTALIAPRRQAIIDFLGVQRSAL